MANYRQEYESTSRDVVFVYCDGGCRGNQKDNNIGGWGVYLKHNLSEHKMSDGERNTTNNIMELKACIYALKFLKNKKRRTWVVVDSNYVYQGITNWIYKWIENGWRTSSKSPVKNKKLWKELFALKSQFEDITFGLCKGHSGVHGNEIADQLANQAMDRIEQEE